MLTCIVGTNKINCFDGKYDKFTLKKWSDENRLICPDCNKLYEYCHGLVIPPYFRHKEKSIICDGIFSESETEEHIRGKMILYNWLLELQDSGLVSNVKLESYIPETRQRPDVYFEQNGERNVIEFQCSPIATEYLERHELYQLAGVNDIWIMGMDKYRLEINNDGDIYHSKHYKEIEKYSFFYLEVESKHLFIIKDVIKKNIPFKLIELTDYYYFDIKYFSIYNCNIYPMNYIMFSFLKEAVETEILRRITIEKTKLYRESMGKYIDLIHAHLIKTYDYSIVKDKYEINFSDIYKSRDILIRFKQNNIEIVKKYREWKRIQIHYDICETISITENDINDILNLIVIYIDNEIEKSKRYK